MFFSNIVHAGTDQADFTAAPPRIPAMHSTEKNVSTYHIVMRPSKLKSLLNPHAKSNTNAQRKTSLSLLIVWADEMVTL